MTTSANEDPIMEYENGYTQGSINRYRESANNDLADEEEDSTPVNEDYAGQDNRTGGKRGGYKRTADQGAINNSDLAENSASRKFRTEIAEIGRASCRERVYVLV